MTVEILGGDMNTYMEGHGTVCSLESCSFDLDGTIEAAGGSDEFKNSLRNASVLLVPSNLAPEYSGPAFPAITPDFLKHLQSKLSGSATVDAAIHDDNYVEFGFRSIDIFLPIIYITEKVLLPLVIGSVASYLAARITVRGKVNNVKSEIHYRGVEGQELSLKYDGPADTYEKVCLEQIKELGKIKESSEQHDEGC